MQKVLKKQNYYTVLTGLANVAGQPLSFYLLPRRNCCLATTTFASLASALGSLDLLFLADRIHVAFSKDKVFLFLVKEQGLYSVVGHLCIQFSRRITSTIADEEGSAALVSMNLQEKQVSLHHFVLCARWILEGWGASDTHGDHGQFANFVLCFLQYPRCFDCD